MNQKELIQLVENNFKELTQLVEKNFIQNQDKIYEGDQLKQLKREINKQNSKKLSSGNQVEIDECERLI